MTTIADGVAVRVPVPAALEWKAPHGDRLLQWGRHVPVITTVIDAAENISLAFDIIDGLTRRPGTPHQREHPRNAQDGGIP